jgi:hypothetical protein
MRRPLLWSGLFALAACGSSGDQGGPSQQGSPDGSANPSMDASTNPTKDGSTVGPHADSSAPPGMDGSSVPPMEGGPMPPPQQPGLGPAQFGPGDLDPPSHGGTITFQQIGGAGWYPSRRDPASGMCDVQNTSSCCTTKYNITSDALSPWDEELVMTLRGPMTVKQMAVYQPATTDPGSDWQLASAWDSANPSSDANFSFDGKATAAVPAFAGGVGSECLVNLATSQTFPCGSGSSPFCPANSSSHWWGWAGSKLFVVLANMAHSGTNGAPAQCSSNNTGGWYDAPWVGLAVGELARAGSFSSCQCFAKTSNWALADGCGQFNVFEVVNDNNSYKNLDVFSTDLIDYSGYVGQGPCGSKCNTATLAPAVDLIDKTNDMEATAGAVASPTGGPSAALRRPENGYRYFLIGLDVSTRTVQLALVHPQNVPASIGQLLPNLPSTIQRATVDAVLGLRLPM